jgi:Sensors of blue-light using FAD
VIQLFGLVYVSTATPLVDLVEIQQLLDRAQQRNARAGLTGVLLYDAGNFMQYVEGPADALARVYASIRGSRLHTGVIEILREPIRVREFPEWSMAFRSAAAFGLSHPAPRDELLMPSGNATPAAMSPARTILSKFWSRSGTAHAF